MSLSKIVSNGEAFIERYNSVVAILVLLLSTTLIVGYFIFCRFSFPPIRQDEASFIDPAYNLLTKGKFSSDLHASFLPGAATYTYWMPPLYMLSLAVFLKIAGIGITHAKSFSMLCVIGASLCLGFSVKKWTTRSWMIALFLVCPFIMFSAVAIRMEAMGILLTTIAILALTFNQSSQQNGLLGIIAALCLMTHPILLACSLALGIIVLRRGAKPFAIFFIAAAVALSPYVLYVMRDYHVFITQMSLQFAQKAVPGLSTLKLTYALQTLTLAVAAVVLLLNIDKSNELKWFLGIGVACTAIVILKSQEFNYHVYVVPYVLAPLGFYMERYQSKLKMLLPVVVFLLFTFLLVGKAKHYHLYGDEAYYDLVSFLSEQEANWTGKKIYVEGEPDVAVLFLVNGQDVERMNGAASQTRDGWADRYEYAICISSRYPTTANVNCGDYTTKGPGEDNGRLTWSRTAEYRSRNDIYSAIIYER